MIALIIAVIGAWLLQDGLASIAFYPAEKWRWNHAFRVARSVMGIILIVIGGVMVQ